MATIAETIENAEKMAVHYEEQAAALIKEYGTGVRPAWVSTDLGIAHERASSYRKMAEELREANDG